MNGTTVPPSSDSMPAWAGAIRMPTALSTPDGQRHVERPDATSSAARATAVEPDAEAFSHCWMARPVAPRRDSMIRPGAMPSIAEPTNAASTSGHGRSPASASAARTAVRPRSTNVVSDGDW